MEELSQVPTNTITQPSPTVTQPTPVYAGFWRRVLAAIIDSILLQVVMSIISVIFGIGSALSMLPMLATDNDAAIAGMIASLVASMMMLIIVSTIVNWLYYSLMESSSLQASLGKMAIGIVVTDLDGNRITFSRATGRYFSKIISSIILCIGYIMVGFTAKKQGLHDIIAGTLVVKK